MKNQATALGIIALATFLMNCATPPKQDERPNIVLIMADDMGFSDLGSYGGEVKTPNLDGLAKNGLRYTQFYNNARCCPTRASLLTGIYPQQAGMGWMTAADLGTPEYQGQINEKCVTIAEVLKNDGYNTYMTGKWHLSRGRNNRAGIKTGWPHQRGFEEFFGIIGGASNYFNPMVYSDNEKYRAPKEDFYFTHAISDSSVMFMDQHFNKAKKNPFFMYVAYTAPHWPLHALEEDIKKYKDIYKSGWDSLRTARFKRQKQLGIFDESVALTPRDEVIPAWESLTGKRKEEFAMRMAIYAAQVDAMDQGIGRIVDKLKKEGELNNTLIFFLSDNGACAEYISSGKSKAVNGKANTFESYRIHWANLGSTPYKEYKHWTHEGGIATPLIAHWPAGIEGKNEFVREPGHINDIMATCLAVSGAEYPSDFKGNKIHSLQGQSLVPHFRGEKNHRDAIFWEHEANIGVRDGKWKLVAKTDEGTAFNTANLELYNMKEDPSEMNNLAKQQPEKLQELYADWQKWAEKVKVHLDTRKYNDRARAYQRMINGKFDEGKGGWNFTGNKVEFNIDTTGQVSGMNSALLTTKVKKETSGVLRWTFRALKGEAFDFSLKTKGMGNTAIQVVFKHVGAEAVTLAETQVKPDGNVKEITLSSKPAEANGRYEFRVEVTGMNSGEQVWIDDVELKPKDAQQMENI